MSSGKPLPEKWLKNQQAAKATQVAFDLDEKFQYSIRKAALDKGVSPSDQIRTILGLSVSKRPKRPRLTVSLDAADYVILAQKYGLDSESQLEIKKRVLDDLVHFVDNKSAK
ncbi:hypothetical protein H5123_00425 [Shewanella sp. SR43-4]|jgi:hypothetical protein|uniref:Ribbon-helix-helix protein, CopG family n=1 Tax=Shewanella vesiculosa TaxID=518738 RepID=A0ABV0FVB5_9GAMM|nr:MULTISPECIES: hypothetical protein [Shewanella]NCQ45442.1 hypothetical protein [Shewanella frigidimarina]MBB1316111.1 hypothetical protein [Shewanella sp. SR43-4]MBB1320863.1 hypothetical protein [Shewanella sp. SR43-8]MBB1387937.1 hypothetical protein [Shewanella sp. SG44-6]MBB1475254.1 hypothetical protein [Shewanella sp. SG41-3]|tara:strand:+ start:2103 stop:2438 length:336 start_codon:yes stop_codon:yes gene_type:complete